MPTLTIFGSAAPGPGTPDYAQARLLGQAAARSGWTICNGGYGGTMAAAAEGAVSAGGHTIGVTCGALGRPGANRWIREEVRTADLPARLAELVRRGDAYAVLPGGTGTLVELALVWELRCKGLGEARPIWLLGSTWRPLCDLLPEASGVLSFAADLPGLLAGLGLAGDSRA